MISSTTCCFSCGTALPEGEGHYSTPSGLFCLACGLKLPIPSGTKVIITIDDPTGRLEKYGKERS